MRAATAEGAAGVAGGGVVGIVSWPSTAHAATLKVSTSAEPTSLSIPVLAVNDVPEPCGECRRPLR